MQIIETEDLKLKFTRAFYLQFCNEMNSELGHYSNFAVLWVGANIFYPLFQHINSSQ